MSGPTLTVSAKDDFRKLLDTIKRDVANARVKVGVLGSDAARTNADATPAGATNVEIAIFNEFGTRTIPERSFLRSALKKHERKYTVAFADLLTAHVERGQDVRQGLDAIGDSVVEDIKDGITEGSEIPPPNAASTLKRKLDLTARGSTGSTRTLVNTGQLATSISHALMKRSEE